MLGESISGQWQAFVRFVRGALWPGRQKPSLMVAIGKRRKANALEEYRRRFEHFAGQGYRLPYLPAAGDQDSRKPPPQPDRDRAAPPPRVETAKPRGRFETPGRRRQAVRLKANAIRSGSSGYFFGAAWALLNLALLRSYHGVAGVRLRWSGLAVVIAGCTLALGGAYLYRMMSADGNDAYRTARAPRPLDRSVEKIEASPGGKKLSYARLTADGPAAEAPAAPSVQASLSKPPSAGPDSPADGALPEDKQTGIATALPQKAPADSQAASKPTIVRSETYLPDGTRIDAARPAPVPSIVRLGTGKPRPPFLAAAQPPEATAAPAPVETQAAPAAGLAEANSAPAAVPVPAAEPAQPLENGYFAQVKSDQDQRAAEAELAAIVEKYKAVLGEVPVKTRSVDLKEKGVWIRVLAGPLKSRDEAANLCKKLKGAGIEACIVQKFE
jgi:SPOR domain